MEPLSTGDSKNYSLQKESSFYYGSLNEVKNTLYKKDEFQKADSICTSSENNALKSKNSSFENILTEISDISEEFQRRFSHDDGSIRFEELFISRAPGRVNLLGEHIDYNGYGVLPFAISRHIILLGGIGKSNTDHLQGIQIENIDSSTYAGVKFKNSTNLLHFQEEKEVEILSFSEIDHLNPAASRQSNANSLPMWIRYIICGYKGVMEYLEQYCDNNRQNVKTSFNDKKIDINVGEIKLKMNNINGLRLLVFGNIPPASGLSSSSALVVASAMFFLSLFNAQSLLTRSELAQLCAASEKYIGTVGGGMDQAVSLLAKENTALNIEFNPSTYVRNTVPLDDNYRIVVANSLTKSEKAVSAKKYFNKRVLECKLGMFILAKHLETKTLSESSNKKSNMKWVQHQNINKLEETYKSQINGFEITLDILKECFHEFPYSLEEIKTILFEYSSSEVTGEKKTQLDKKFLSLFPDKLQEIIMEVQDSSFSESTEEFPLYIFHRMIHVFSEKSRVRYFVDKALQLQPKDNDLNLAFYPSLTWGLDSDEWLNTKTSFSESTILQEYDNQSKVLGALMNMSHESCRAFYDCSCKELNDLINICRTNDTCLGSRLTGAGWGGCCISLVAEGEVEGFIEMLKEHYYTPILQQELQQKDIEEYIFVSTPGTGSWCTKMAFM